MEAMMFQIRKNEVHMFDYFKISDLTFECKELLIRISWVVQVNDIIGIDGDVSDITSNYDISDEEVLEYFVNATQNMSLKELSVGVPFNPDRFIKND